MKLLLSKRLSIAVLCVPAIVFGMNQGKKQAASKAYTVGMIQAAGLALRDPQVEETAPVVVVEKEQSQAAPVFVPAASEIKRVESLEEDLDEIVLSKKPSIWTRISDSWNGADTNVIAEIEANTFDLSDRGSAAHRIEWAINEAIKKDVPKTVRTIVLFCQEKSLQINRDFLTRARRYLKKKNKEDLVALLQIFEGQSDQVRANKKALKSVESLYGAGYGSSDEEGYSSMEKIFTKMKEHKKSQSPSAGSSSDSK